MPHRTVQGGPAVLVLGDPVRTGLEEQPGHLEPAFRRFIRACFRPFGDLQGRVAAIVLRDPERTLSVCSHQLSPSPIGTPANPRGRLQQAAATGFSHLGVDVSAGHEEQPGHLKVAFVCGDVQGRLVDIVLRDPEPTQSVC